MTKKQRTLLEKLGSGKRMLPAQIQDVASAKKLLQLGYATMEDDGHVKDWSRGGAPAQVLVITEDGRTALAG